MKFWLVAICGITAIFTAADPLQPDSIVPEVVTRLADAYIASLPEKPDSAAQKVIRRGFARHFFMGFTRPGSSMAGGTDADYAAFQAGKQYRRTRPEKLKEIMEGFGYAATSAEGNWSIHSEHSGFRTRNHSGRDWWVSLMPDPEPSRAVDASVPTTGGVVRVSGFLSPKGDYGHMGDYDRRFYATNISLISIDQQKDNQQN